MKFDLALDQNAVIWFGLKQKNQYLIWLYLLVFVQKHTKPDIWFVFVFGYLVCAAIKHKIYLGKRNLCANFGSYITHRQNFAD